jgi:modulator of FtsH protease
MEGWHDFFVAQAGAAVAFAGLVLVSVSINLDRIIKVDGLIGRSAEPLVILFSLFVASSIMLVPDQSTRIYGLAVLVLAIAFAIVIAIVLRNQRAAALIAEASGVVPKSSFRARAALCAITAAFLISAGLLMAFGSERGLYLMVPAVITGFLLSFLDAWVLLIEIDR